jgi:hypothetical protein
MHAWEVWKGALDRKGTCMHWVSDGCRQRLLVLRCACARALFVLRPWLVLCHGGSSPCEMQVGPERLVVAMMRRANTARRTGAAGHAGWLYCGDVGSCFSELIHISVSICYFRLSARRIRMQYLENHMKSSDVHLSHVSLGTWEALI